MQATPVRSPRCDGQTGRWERGTVIALGFVLASFFPYFERIHSANELSRVYLANALALHGTVRIDQQLREHGDIGDKSIRNGHFYSDKPPGVAFVLVPVVYGWSLLAGPPSLRDEVRVARLLVSTLPSCVLFALLLVLMRSEVRDGWWRIASLVLYSLGTLATTYSMLAFGHQLSAVLLVVVFALLRSASFHSSAGPPFLVGLTAAFAIAVEYQNAVYLMPLVVYGAVRTRLAPRLIAATFAGALLPLALLGFYHHAAFGMPWLTGYSFVASSFRDVHAQGFMGISVPTWDNLSLSLVSPSKGLLFYSPVLLWAIPGILIGFRRSVTVRIGAMVATVILLFVASMVYPVGGWTVGQRHLTPAVPWLVVPLAIVLARWSWARSTVIGLGLVGIVMNGTSAVVWPHYHENFANPVFQVGLPLLRTGFVPPSLLSGVGVSSRSLLVVHAAVVLLLLLFILVRTSKTWLGGVAHVVVTLLVVATALAAMGQAGMSQDVRTDLEAIRNAYDRDPATPSISALDAGGTAQ